MMWFKHRTDASKDQFICALEAQLGLEDYARWWKLLEAIAGQMNKDNSCYAEYSIELWKNILSMHYLRTLKEFICFCISYNMIQIESPFIRTLVLSKISSSSKIFDKISKTGVMRIHCPKLLELRDEYSRKLSRTPDKPPTKNATDTETDKLIIKPARTMEEFERQLAAEIAALNKADLEKAEREKREGQQTGMKPL